MHVHGYSGLQKMGISIPPLHVSMARYESIQFLTILSAYADLQEAIATNNNSGAVPSDANALTMPTP